MVTPIRSVFERPQSRRRLPRMRSTNRNMLMKSRAELAVVGGPLREQGDARWRDRTGFPFAAVPSRSSPGEALLAPDVECMGRGRSPRWTAVEHAPVLPVASGVRPGARQLRVRPSTPARARDALDIQHATAEGRRWEIVQREPDDRVVSGSAQRDEREAARQTCHAIEDELDVSDDHPRERERSSQLSLGRPPGHAADEDVVEERGFDRAKGRHGDSVSTRDARGPSTEPDCESRSFVPYESERLVDD
jgi:hypothetical protein